MKTACGQFHFGPLTSVGPFPLQAVVCQACGKRLSGHEVMAFGRISLQARQLMTEAKRGALEFLKRRAA